MNQITQEQADVIGEVSNICTGNAATTLSLLLNHATDISTPTVSILSNEEELQREDRVLVKIPYTKGLDGTNLMILQVKDALIISNLMMGGDGHPAEAELDEISVSAISEAMNQMCGTIATSMATLLGTPTDIGFPLVNSKFKTTFQIPDELCNGSDIVKVTFRLTVGDLIDSQLMQLYPISIVKQILKQEDK